MIKLHGEGFFLSIFVNKELLLILIFFLYVAHNCHKKYLSMCTSNNLHSHTKTKKRVYIILTSYKKTLLIYKLKYPFKVKE